jgi:polysaccharide biosynthesis protein PelC
MKRHTPAPFAIALTAALILTGCAMERAFVKKDFSAASAGLTVVFPFENLSTNAGGGDIATANFLTELRHAGRFPVADAAMVIKPLADAKEPLGDLSALSMARKMELAKAVNADAVITGKVTEFKYKSGLGEEPVVGLNVQMVKIATGEVVWNGSVSVTGGLFSFVEPSLNRYAQCAARRLVCSLKKGR